LFEPEFDQIAVIGVESFAAPFPTNTYQLGKEEIEAWLDLIEAAGQTPEGLAMSDHFLYVGNKKK
jgi:hypothetical protein